MAVKAEVLRNRLVACSIHAPGAKKEQHMIVHIVDDTNWDTCVINNPRPTLVTFTSPHCPVCAHLGPELDRTALHFPTVSLFTCDVVQSPDTKRYYGIDGTPRSILFIGGLEQATLRGFQYTPTIIDFITQHTGIHPINFNLI